MLFISSALHSKFLTKKVRHRVDVIGCLVPIVLPTQNTQQRKFKQGAFKFVMIVHSNVRVDACLIFYKSSHISNFK